MSATNPHDGHRARMRERFLQNGSAGFADHEWLELLLYYTIPRRDTNDLSHRLMERFGSISAVLEADVDSLVSVEGVSHASATFLSLVGETARRYAAEKLERVDKKQVFDTPEKIAAFMMPRYLGVGVERAYLLLFDNAMHLLDCFHVCDGSVTGVTVSVRRIAERAFQKGAAAAILTHNHPNGIAVPSGEDMRLTRQLDEALRLLEIPLLEHYIFSDCAFVPIMSRIRAKEAHECAASSLLDVYRARTAELHALGDFPLSDTE